MVNYLRNSITVNGNNNSIKTSTIYEEDVFSIEVKSLIVKNCGCMLFQKAPPACQVLKVATRRVVKDRVRQLNDPKIYITVPYSMY